MPKVTMGYLETQAFTTLGAVEDKTFTVVTTLMNESDISAGDAMRGQLAMTQFNLVTDVMSSIVKSTGDSIKGPVQKM